MTSSAVRNRTIGRGTGRLRFPYRSRRDLGLPDHETLPRPARRALPRGARAAAAAARDRAAAADDARGAGDGPRGRRAARHDPGPVHGAARPGGSPPRGPARDALGVRAVPHRDRRVRRRPGRRARPHRDPRRDDGDRHRDRDRRRDPGDLRQAPDADAARPRHRLVRRRHRRRLDDRGRGRRPARRRRRRLAVRARRDLGRKPRVAGRVAGAHARGHGIGTREHGAPAPSLAQHDRLAAGRRLRPPVDDLLRARLVARECLRRARLGPGERRRRCWR